MALFVFLLAIYTYASTKLLFLFMSWYLIPYRIDRLTAAIGRKKADPIGKI